MKHGSPLSFLVYYLHMNIVWGLVLAAIGTWIVWKTETLLRMFGRVTWAEQNMQLQGGSRMYYKLVGLVLIFIGFLMITGLARGFAMATVGKLFGL